jgi:uncharacterized protein (DUF1684 family)
MPRSPLLALLLTLLPLVVLAAGSTPSAPPNGKGASTWEKEVRDWRAARQKRLTSPTGWLTLIGLEWLEKGENGVGSASSNRVRLPEGKIPAQVGIIDWKKEGVHFRSAPGAIVTAGGKEVGEIDLVSDAAGEPTILEVGPVSFQLIDRAGKLGVRIKDREAKTLRDFKGIENFSADPKWRIEARWQPYPSPKKVRTPTVIGTQEEQTVPGAAIFEIAGKSCRLEPVLEDPEATELFFVFGDLTNGRATYGGGRFLYASLPKDGKIVLDFNLAYNPPCVFTNFATCPLPRPEDRLPVWIEAGEKAYHGAGH